MKIHREKRSNKPQNGENSANPQLRIVYLNMSRLNDFTDFKPDRNASAKPTSDIHKSGKIAYMGALTNIQARS
jgi:hypothetical protein